MDMIITADFRVAALEATNRLQREIGFDDSHKASVENTIFKLMRDAFERAAPKRTDELNSIVDRFWRNSLVIESALRNQGGEGSVAYEDVMAAIRSAQDYMKDMTPKRASPKHTDEQPLSSEAREIIESARWD